MSNQVPLNFYPQTQVSVSENGDTLSAFNGIAYQWYLNGQIISGATSPTYIALVPGSYQVLITDSNGCQASSSALLVSGIENLASDNIRIYPNPLSGSDWQLDVSSALIGSKLEIFDAGGRLVYNAEVKNLKSQFSLNLASGIYFLRLYSQQINVLKKLVKL